MTKKNKYRHNKRRNVAFLFEVLSREIAKCALQNNIERKDNIIKIIKEHFRKDSLLAKELEIYNTLLELSRVKDRYIAEKILFEAKKQFKEINSEELFDKQTKFIHKLNKMFGTEIYDNFVPNYKSLATIAQVLNADLPAKRRVVLEETLFKNIREQENKKMEPIDSLVLKNFIKKFNTTYSPLLKEQKELLSSYIMSFSDNGVEFKLYLNEEIGRLKEKIKSVSTINEIQSDLSMKEKTNELIEMLKEYHKTPINSDMIKNILKMQEFIKEAEEN